MDSALMTATKLPDCLRRAHATGLRAEANALAEMAEEMAGSTAATLMLQRALGLDERADAIDASLTDAGATVAFEPSTPLAAFHRANLASEARASIRLDGQTFSASDVEGDHGRG